MSFLSKAFHRAEAEVKLAEDAIKKGGVPALEKGAEHLIHEAEKVVSKVALAVPATGQAAKIVMQWLQDGMIVAKVLVVSPDFPKGIIHIVSTYAMDRLGVPKSAEQKVNDLLDAGITLFLKHTQG